MPVDMSVDSNLQPTMQPGGTTRSPQLSPSALAAASAAAANAPHFPGEDGGRSLTEMAQRDLDAALQLLADRAQYITGSSGAAIALRRDGRNDMLCRASTGVSAPELGALLSTEFGLSGESVRTRQPLRCDDAERDARVNREACRQMGIASVAVMPVVNDDQVLGVFELFSPQVNAFGERDISALRRLSEMVETAVKLARAAEELPQRLAAAEASIAEPAAESAAQTVETQTVETKTDEIEADDTTIDEADVLELVDETSAEPEGLASKDSAIEDPVIDDPAILEVAAEPAAAVPSILPQPATAAIAEKATEPVVAETAVDPGPESLSPGPPHAAPAAFPKKPLFWSATPHPAAETHTAESDQSHVPPVLRNLRKCVACGFPVSPTRTLCVECEEKKWRGQLRVPQLPRLQTPSATASGARTAAAAAAAAAPAPLPAPKSVLDASSVTAPAQQPVANVQKEVQREVQKDIPHLAAPKPLAAAPKTPLTPAPELVLTAAMKPSQSWLSANKYIVGALLLVAATVAAILVLR